MVWRKKIRSGKLMEKNLNEKRIFKHYEPTLSKFEENLKTFMEIAEKLKKFSDNVLKFED